MLIGDNMISHIIAFVLAIAILLSIYIFTGEIFVLGMIILLVVFLLFEIICNIIVARSVDVSVEMKNSSMANKNVLISISLNNRSFIPVIRGVMRFRIKNISFDITEGFTKEFSLKHGKRDIVYEMDSEYCGRYEVILEHIRLYDFMGITYADALRKAKKIVYLFPVCGYIGSVSEIQRVNYEKERYFNHKKNIILSEILQYREYEPGDNLRHINWKLSDKLDELLVREFDTPTDNQVLVTYDVDNKNKKTKSIVYSTIMSIAATYIRNKLFHQIGWYRKTDGRIIRRDMYKFDDLYKTMKMLFDEDSGNRPMEILYLIKSGELMKYAKVIYVTNYMPESLKKELSIYENIQVIYIDEETFIKNDTEGAIHAIAV